MVDKKEDFVNRHNAEKAASTRYRQHHHDKFGGHLYQVRFNSFPVQEDSHLLTVLRYVEANPLRAQLPTRVGEWPWSTDEGEENAPGSSMSPFPSAFSFRL